MLYSKLSYTNLGSSTTFSAHGWWGKEKNNSAAKKSALQKIFGSNLQLHNQKVSGTAHPLYAALRAARQNPYSSGSLQLSAPRVGVEPTTNSLTGSCSTIELPRNVPFYKLATTEALQFFFALQSSSPVACLFCVNYHPIARKSSGIRVFKSRVLMQI